MTPSTVVIPGVSGEARGGEETDRQIGARALEADRVELRGVELERRVVQLAAPGRATPPRRRPRRAAGCRRAPPRAARARLRRRALDERRAPIPRSPSGTTRPVGRRVVDDPVVLLDRRELRRGRRGSGRSRPSARAASFGVIEMRAPWPSPSRVSRSPYQDGTNSSAVLSARARPGCASDRVEPPGIDEAGAVRVGLGRDRPDERRGARRGDRSARPGRAGCSRRPRRSASRSGASRASSTGRN